MGEHNPPTDHWAIIVVHGVGDRVPGRTLDALAAPLSAMYPDLRLSNHEVLYTFPEKTAGGRNSEFVALGRAGESRDFALLVTEVYWADLTRAETGLAAYVAQLFGMVYGIRYIAIRASAGPGRLACFVNALYRLALLLLQGPIFALLIFQTMQSVAYLALFPPSWDATAARARGAIALAALGLVAALLGALGWVSSRGNPLRRPLTWQWLFGVGLAAAVTGVLRACGWLDRVFNQSLYEGLNPCGIVVGDWPLLLMATDKLLDRLLSVMAYLMGIALLAVLFSLLLDRKSARNIWGRKPARSLWISFVAMAALIALWEAALEPINFTVQRAESWGVREKIPTYTLWFSDGCLAALGILLAATAALIVFLRGHWSRGKGAGSWPARAPRRLIVGGPVQFVIVLVITAYILLEPWDAMKGLKASGVPYPYIHLLALGFFGFTVVLSAALRNVFHVLRDVVGHFESPGANTLVGRRFPRYLLRRRIMKRFAAVLKKALAERTTHLLVIAHSQGTMFALEELCHKRWQLPLRRLKAVNLITMGSPFTHIYQEYFPLEYGGLDQGRWLRLRGIVRNWLNVFRVDDYVGTHIAGTANDWPVNVPLCPGTGMRGHTHYWEPGVFHYIQSVAPDCLPPVACPWSRLQ